MAATVPSGPDAALPPGEYFFVLGADGQMRLDEAKHPRAAPEGPAAAGAETVAEADEEQPITTSPAVADAVTPITRLEELQAVLREHAESSRLVLLQVESSDRCDMGCTEEAEVHWKRLPEEIMAPCVALRRTLAAAAQRCPGVTVLSLTATDTPECQALCDRLQVTHVPSLFFIREARVVWRIDGVDGAEEDLRDGLAYFGDHTLEGDRPSDLIEDLHSVDQCRRFVGPGASEDLLRVVAVFDGQQDASVRMFRAVVALSGPMQGKASFARVLSDGSPQALAVLRELRAEYVPLLLIYDGRTGEELGRHVVTTREDLIGLYLDALEQQKARLDAAVPEAAVPEAAVPPRSRGA